MREKNQRIKEVGDFTSGVEGATTAVALERHLECERIIAACVPAFVRGENNLSDEGEMASAFGWSMLTSLLYGLRYPQTKEAKDAIELVFKNLEYPCNCQGLSECLQTFGAVPRDSNLPRLIAEEMRGFGVPEDTMDYDGIGDRLPFFSGCTVEQIREHLVPLTTLHPIESIRNSIGDWIYSNFPQTIPVNDFRMELLELCGSEELTPTGMQHGEKLVGLLTRSELPREDLLRVYEKVLKLTLPHDYYTWVSVAQSVVEALVKGESTNDAISHLIMAQAQLATTQEKVTLATVTYFKYLKKFCPGELERTVVDFLDAERHHWRSSPESARCVASIELLSGVTEERSYVLLGEILSSGGLVPYSVSKSPLAHCIAQSDSLERKGKVVADFLVHAEHMTRQVYFSGRDPDAASVRQRALEPSHYNKISRVALALSSGGFAGDRALSVLRDALSDCYEIEASVETITAARLVGGHQAPEAERLLLQAFLDTGDSQLQEILADSLAIRRSFSTPTLIGLLSDPDPNRIAITIRAFTGATDSSEISAISAACEKYSPLTAKTPVEGEKVIIAAMDALVDSPGTLVDDLFYAALTSSNNRIKAHAIQRCFPLRAERKWFIKYRSEDHLVNLSMRLHQAGIGTTDEKIARIELLGRHSDSTAVYDFLREEAQKELFDDQLSVALFSAVTTIPSPAVLKEYLNFLQRRERELGSTPSIHYDVTPIGMRKFNPGDSVHLERAMKLLAERKAQMVAVGE